MLGDVVCGMELDVFAEHPHLVVSPDVLVPARGDPRVVLGDVVAAVPALGHPRVAEVKITAEPPHDLITTPIEVSARATRYRASAGNGVTPAVTNALSSTLAS